MYAEHPQIQPDSPFPARGIICSCCIKYQDHSNERPNNAELGVADGGWGEKGGKSGMRAEVVAVGWDVRRVLKRDEAV